MSKKAQNILNKINEKYKSTSEIWKYNEEKELGNTESLYRTLVNKEKEARELITKMFHFNLLSEKDFLLLNVEITKIYKYI